MQGTLGLKKQKIVVTGAKSVVANIDSSEIKLVMINLLENASKYSYDNTDIVIDISTDEKQVQITVKDNGVGIKKQDIARIFDKFTRVDNDLSDTVSGTGLGLYWVERIINLHDGSIAVESRKGKGSTFCIRLPL